MIAELPEINSGFASCYPKFANKIWVLGISGSGILYSEFGLQVFCPGLVAVKDYRSAPKLAKTGLVSHYWTGPDR
jgi:hypothetical protein